MGIQLKNNAVGYLATAINASDTGAVLQTGNGASFPTLGATDYFYATLESTGGTLEIVKVTVRSGDSLTITRAQDGSTANSFAAGSRFELRVTAGSVVGYVQDRIVSVRDFGAVGDGVTNDTAAFTLARAVNTRYFIPSGTYLLDASPDVWTDCFQAAGNTFIKIGATTYNVSNAFAGRLRYSVGSNVLTFIVDAVTNNNVIGIQNSQPGTATYFTRGLAFITDSHFIQAQPATNGGSTDLLFQRSTLNADPAGNRFSLTFEENIDRLLLSYATTASGAPAFDTAMQIIAGTVPSLVFPALILSMKQGYTIQTRALGALVIQNYPTSDTTQAIRDATTGNVLQKINRTRQDLAGVAFDTLFDTPQGVTQPRMFGGVFSDTGSTRDGDLPITKNLWSTLGATNGNQVIGTLMVAIATSAGNVGYRESRFVFNGTTVTLTDLVNTLPVQVVATVAVSGTNLQFQASYAGGLGAGCTVTAMINWCGAGR